MAKSGTERQVEGTVEKWKGKAKEKAGEVLDDPGLQEEGRKEQDRGAIREHAGEMQRKAERLERDEEQG